MKIGKNIRNLEIVELLRAVAASYKLKDENKNRFKIIAYERAADAVEHLSSEAKDLFDEDKLETVSGIGKNISTHLGEIFKTGKSTHFEKLMKGLPPSMFEMIKVPGIGAKTAYKLSVEFKSDLSDKDPLKDLVKLAERGYIAKLEGMGVDSQDAILKGIKELKGRTKRLLLPYAEQLASEVVVWLKKRNDVIFADPLGSLRRRSSTVGDVDISIASTNPKDVIDHFCKYPKASRVLERGDRTASIILPGDRQVDLMVALPDSYGSLLQHFTGSKHHNIALREYAKSLKPSMSLSEYGIRKVKIQNSKIKKFKTEEKFYKYLDLEWIPPELREDSGEIDAARAKKLPVLVEDKDIKADLQIHSNFNIETSHDLGASSMINVANKANMLGYEYIAFTEHNPSHSKHNDKQVIKLLGRKKAVVERINIGLGSPKAGDSSSKLKAGSKTPPRLKRVFNSLEIDILPDGKLPVTNAGLELLDFALISIHSSFKLSKKKMTNRVLRAFDHHKVKIFAHPTARKLNEREGVELDWDKIFDFCRNNGKWIEINADPMRLDLPDFLIKEAVKYGVKLTLGTDAHHIDHMDNMQYGVYVARRGWAEKKDIINTYSLREFEKMIK
jgi:DNA polymerase (family 10)